MRTVDTDYLVVGAGTAGMGFVDTVLAASDREVVMVDRRPGPGGHWLEGYPFLRLHLPSDFYGVESMPLPSSAVVQSTGPEAGWFERGSGAEVCAYFDDVMRRRLLPSGRVRFLPRTEHLGGGRVRSLLSGKVTEVRVREAVVDATRNGATVPESSPPPFEVADGARCVTPTGLTRLCERPAGYVVIGSGKTAMDTCGWLLEQGADPDAIAWIRPRDTWALDRRYFQPAHLRLDAVEGTALQVEAAAAADTANHAFLQLERDGVMMRLDTDVLPTMFRAPSLSRHEAEVLRSIRRVVRRGYVRRIGADRILLAGGEIPTSRATVHVHCAAPGLPTERPGPVFADDVITLQLITRYNASLSVAMIGRVACTDLPLAEKNRLCASMPVLAGTPEAFFPLFLSGLVTEAAWRDHPELQTWLRATRLNTTGRTPDGTGDDDMRRMGARVAAAMPAALARLAVWGGG